MPSTVNIVSGSILVANMGFTRIGGAKIVTKSDIHTHTRWYKRTDQTDTKDLDDIARPIIASSLVMTAKTIVTAVTWLDRIRVKDTRISLTIQNQEENVASSECNARYSRGRLAFTTVDNLPLFTLSRSWLLVFSSS